MDPIAPVTGLIDKVEELIGHSPHPAIVALPIGAWAVSNLCDTLALATGDDRYDDVARISLAIGMVGAAGAVITGLRDYSHIDRDKPSHDTATAHGLGNAVVTSLMAASLVLRSREERGGGRTSLLARALSLAGGGLSLYTAWLGGVLVENFGEAVKPVMERDKAADDAHGRERLAPEAPLGVHHA